MSVVASILALSPELGSFFLVLSLCVALLQAVLPIFLVRYHYASEHAALSVQRRLTALMALCISLAFLLLIVCMLRDDFTVGYVASHSNSLLPWPFKVSAAWGGHEGSFVLWIMLLSYWVMAFAVVAKRQYLSPDYVFQRYALSVLGLIIFGFLAFVLFSSNPFTRNLPWFEMNGRDLNPLLQDVGLIIHPPMLYMGYVGFAIPFALAIAGMLTGQVDKVWALWVKPWVTLALGFLTVGIALGSWWAYYELGWGGWWFWDPVENASLMPWLAGVALLHALVIVEKRASLKSWALLLAIVAFGLSLLGTFLVRSGVLTSVHSFASDPLRGIFILILLAAYVGGALLFYALKAGQYPAETRAQIRSKEVGLLLANMVWVSLLFAVLSATVIPLIAQAFGTPVSFGPPFFNRMVSPLAYGLLFMLAVVPFMQWNTSEVMNRSRLLMAGIFLCIGLVFAVVVKGAWQEMRFVVTMVLVWLAVASQGMDIIKRFNNKTLNNLRYWAMAGAHMGFVVFVIGVLWVSYTEKGNDFFVKPNDTIRLANYDLTFKGSHIEQRQNYATQVGTVEVYQNGQHITVLHPEKRRYKVGQMMMTEAAIDAGLFRDVYVALGDQVDEQADSWALRVYYKPMIRFIWLGCLIMAFSCVLLLFAGWKSRSVRNTVFEGRAHGE